MKERHTWASLLQLKSEDVAICELQLVAALMRSWPHHVDNNTKCSRGVMFISIYDNIVDTS